MANATMDVETRLRWYLKPLYWAWILTWRYFDIEPDTVKATKLFFKWRILPNGKWRSFY